MISCNVITHQTLFKYLLMLISTDTGGKRDKYWQLINIGHIFIQLLVFEISF